MPRRSNRTTKRTRRAFNVQRKGARGQRNNPPADPPSYRPVKWQSLMLEFDLTASAVAYGAFNSTDILRVFRTQTGQNTVTIEFKFKKIDAWNLANDQVDISGFNYDLTRDDPYISDQKTDVAGKNHWPRIRLNWPAKDRQTVFTSTVDKDIAAFYFGAEDNVIRVRAHILWRFETSGVPPHPGQRLVKSKVVKESGPLVIPSPPTSEVQSNASSKMKSKTFTGSSLSIKDVTREVKAETYHYNRYSQIYWRYKVDEYVVVRCGRCHGRIRTNTNLDNFPFVSNDDMEQHRKRRADDPKWFESFKKNYKHICVVDATTSPKRKNRGKRTLRSQVWKEVSSSLSTNSVTPSQSVSNVTVNVLMNKIDQLERQIAALSKSNSSSNAASTASSTAK